MNAAASAAASETASPNPASIETVRPKSPDMIERLNAIPVSVEMLTAATQSIDAMADEKRGSFDQRMIVLVGAMREFETATKIPLAALAIDFRLRALVRLLETTPVYGCEIDLVTRRPNFSTRALRAAASQRLVSNGVGLAAFDVADFRSRLLN